MTTTILAHHDRDQKALPWVRQAHVVQRREGVVVVVAVLLGEGRQQQQVRVGSLRP